MNKNKKGMLPFKVLLIIMTVAIIGIVALLLYLQLSPLAYGTASKIGQKTGNLWDKIFTHPLGIP